MTRSFTDDDREFNRAFGERMRSRRLELGMAGPLELAKKMGMPDQNSTLSAIERGSHFPRPLYLIEIAKALGVSSSYLLDDIDTDGDYRAGYRAAIADVYEHLAPLNKKGKS